MRLGAATNYAFPFTLESHLDVPWVLGDIIVSPRVDFLHDGDKL